jgi:serine/threonine protein kinase
MTAQLPYGYPDAQSWLGQNIGNYRLVRLLGEGGMGMVFEAVHDGVGGKAAVKILRAEVSARADLAARFFNEARAANAIQHPGIVRIFDCGYTQSNAAFLTMEFLEGDSLRSRLERAVRLPLSDVMRIGRQLGSALVASHRKGIIHRDLKPDNIMLVADPDLPGGERVKVLDFGIAKMAESLGALPHATDSNLVMGTPAYMSPEQCRGAKQVTDRADVYSLGVILYQMVAGRPPFVADAVGELLIMQVTEPVPPLDSFAPGTERTLVSLIHSMLAKDAVARPGMDAVIAALQQVEKATTESSQPYRRPDLGPTNRVPVLQTRPMMHNPSAAPILAGAVAAVDSQRSSEKSKLHVSTVTDAASEVNLGSLLSKQKRKRRILTLAGTAVVIMTFTLAGRLLSQFSHDVVVTQPIVKKVALVVQAPKPPSPLEPKLVSAVPAPIPAPVDSRPPGAPMQPFLPTKVNKVVDPHYEVARKHYKAHLYKLVIADTESCGTDYLFQCNWIRGKAACHTPNRSAAQTSREYLEQSGRKDRDKAIAEIKFECESDSLDEAENFLRAKKYKEARNIAANFRPGVTGRGWVIYGLASCGLEDSPAVHDSLSQLQTSQAKRVRAACKPELYAPPL